MSAKHKHSFKILSQKLLHSRELRHEMPFVWNALFFVTLYIRCRYFDLSDTIYLWCWIAKKKKCYYWGEIWV